MELLLKFCFGVCLLAVGAVLGAITTTNKNQRKIIMDQKELAAALKAATETIEAQNLKIDALTVGLAKIGAETDGLQAAITRLEEAVANQSGVSEEVKSATESLVAAIGKQVEAVGAARTAVAAVDEKVPDAVATAPGGLTDAQ